MPPTSSEVIVLDPLITERELRFAMGIPDGATLKRRLARLFPDVLAAVEAEAQPKLIWRIETTATLQTLLGPSRRLTRYLETPENAALVAATVGAEWDALTAAEADPMRQYLFAAAGTALARSTLVKARRELAHRYPGARIGDSLSPGTDGLPLAVQADIAQALPLAEIGIHFDPEAHWMQPLASVTAVIAFGSSVEPGDELPLCGEAAPRCPACPSARCGLRVSPYHPKRSRSRSRFSSPSELSAPVTAVAAHPSSAP